MLKPNFSTKTQKQPNLVSFTYTTVMRSVFLFLAMTFFAFGSSAQRTCNTMELHAQKMTNPNYAKKFKAKQQAVAAAEKVLCADPVVLPMAVHFSGVGALSATDEACLIALAQNQIQILNDDYNGTNADITNWTNGASANYPGLDYGETCIQFCLATRNHPAGYGLNDGDFAVTFNQVTGDNDPAWAGYINIWVKNISALGYSPLGGSGNGDGVAISLTAFGSGAGCAGTGVVPSAPYNLGRTLTHELGHYLLLEHIWGGGCNSDDGIADTPDAQTSNYGCPAANTTSCNSLDLHMNYMDYTNDACMYMFSAGQSTVMENYTANNLAAVAANFDNVCGSNMIVEFVETSSAQTEGSENCSTGGTHTVTVELAIGAAPSANLTATVTVNAASTATVGEDYQSFSGNVVFPAGSTANQSIDIIVKEDAYVEATENIIIDISGVSDTDFSVGNNAQHTHTISDDDRAPLSGVVGVLLDQNFDADVSGWTVDDGGSAGDTWGIVSDYNGSSLDGSNFAFVDSDAAGNGSTSYEILYSPVLNATGFSDLTLTFDHYFRAYTAGYNESIDVDVFDGTTWQNVYSADGSGGIGSFASPVSESIDILAYANSALQLRFVYDAEWDYYWAVDNVRIEGTFNDGIQTDNNTAAGFAEHDLGPFQTVHYFDPMTGNIMLSIENLSGHDYGCTQVTVDNAGTGSYASGDAAYEDVTEKNFLITPQFNNAAGAYNITLYYTAAEIDGWVTGNANGDPVTDLMMLKSDGSMSGATTVEAVATTAAAFGTDWAYTSGFATGFSGFALGDQAVVLPVEWLETTAKPVETNIEISWATALEVDNEIFHVKRRTESRYETIGSVSPNTDGRYLFTDKNVRPGVVYYYQIEQRDFDGTASNSRVVSAKIQAENSLSVQPNPFKNELQLTGNAAEEAITVAVYDVLGRQVYQTVTRGRLNLQDLQNGVYFIRLTAPGGLSSTHRVVKE